MDDGRVIPRDALFTPPRFVANNVLVDDDVHQAVANFHRGAHCCVF